MPLSAVRLARKKQINVYLEAIDEAFTDVAANASVFETNWPGNGRQLQSSFTHFSALNLLSAVRKLEANLNLEKIANSLQNPYACLFPLTNLGLIPALKVAQALKLPVSQKDVLSVFEFFYRLVGLRIGRDYFQQKKSFLVLTENETDKIINSQKWIFPKSDFEKKLTLGLGVNLEAYSWALFYDLYRSLGFLVHGPYKVKLFGTDKILLAKEGLLLNPIELWSRRFPFARIKLFLIYKKDFDLRINIFNQLISLASPLENLLSFALEVDGECIGEINECEHIDDALTVEINKQKHRADKMSRTEILQKGALIYHYALKDFFNLAAMDWRPNESIIQAIKKDGDLFWEKNKSGLSKTISYRDVFDPRLKYDLQKE